MYQHTVYKCQLRKNIVNWRSVIGLYCLMMILLSWMIMEVSINVLCAMSAQAIDKPQKKRFFPSFSLSSHQGRELTCRILLLAVSKSIKHFFQFQNHHLSTKIGKTNKHKIQSKYSKAKKDTNPRVISGKSGSSASRPDHDEIEETRIQLVSEILWQNIGVPLKLLRERLASFYAGPRIINSANNLLTLRSQKNNIPESDNKKASIATDIDPSERV